MTATGEQSAKHLLGLSAQCRQGLMSMIEGTEIDLADGACPVLVSKV